MKRANDVPKLMVQLNTVISLIPFVNQGLRKGSEKIIERISTINDVDKERKYIDVLFELVCFFCSKFG